jgi:hypothetical protein
MELKNHALLPKIAPAHYDVQIVTKGVQCFKLQVNNHTLAMLHDTNNT